MIEIKKICSKTLTITFYQKGFFIGLFTKKQSRKFL